MSFVKISDPKRRDEIIQEYLRTKRSIQQQSFDKILEDKNIYTQGEKLFKPIIDAQKDTGEQVSKELQKVTSSLEPLKMLPGPSGPLPIEAPLPPEFTGVKFGEIATKALSETIGKPDAYDNVTGLYTNEGKFFLGDKEVNFNGDNIIIDGVEYKGTPGLWQLITSKKPLDGSYNPNDFKVYSDIMQRTNAIRSEKNPSRPKLNTGPKWRGILKSIWNEQTGKKPRTSTPKKKGKGLATGYGVEFLPSDPMQLLNQLKLAFASNQAGNTGERNRIVSILEALLGMEQITKNEYKTIAQDIK